MEQPKQDKSKLLYDAVSKDYDIGTYDEFKTKLQSPEKRKAFYDGVGSEYDLGTYDDFEAKVNPLKKKGDTQPSSSQKPSSASSGSATSSGGSKSKNYFPKITTPKGYLPDVDNLRPTEGQLRQELKNAKVTPENMDEIDKKTNQLRDIEREKEQAKREHIKKLENNFYSTIDPKGIEAEATQEADDIINKKGFFNTVEDYARTGYNKLLDAASSSSPELLGLQKLKANPDATTEHKAKVIADAKKNGETLNQQEIKDRTRKSIIKEQKDALYDDRVATYLDELPEEDKNALYGDRYVKFDHLNEENQNTKRVIEVKKTLLETKLDDYRELESDLLNRKKTNKPISQEEIDLYNAQRDELKNLASGLESTYKNLQKNETDLGTAEQELDMFKRDYGDIYGMLNKAGLQAIDLGAGFLSGLDHIATLGGTFDKEGYENTLKAKKEVQEWTNEQREFLRKPVSEVKSVWGAINYVTDVISNQAPLLATTMIGAEGLVAMGVSSTGQKAAEMNKEVKEGKAIYTPLQTALVPILWGSAEVVSEKINLDIIKKSGRILSAVERSAPELFKQSAAQKSKEFFKEAGLNFLKEEAGENGTNLFQNGLDKFALKKENVNILDNTGDTFKDTAVINALIGFAPQIAGEVLKEHTSYEDMVALDSNSKRMIEYAKQLNNPRLTATEKQVINGEIQKINAESTKILKKTIKNIDKMPQPLYQEILNINSKATTLKTQAEEINNGTLPESQKKALTDSLKAEFKDLMDKRSKILNGEMSVVDVLPLQQQDKLKKEALGQLTTELNPDGKKDVKITNEMITERAHKIYQENVEKAETKKAFDELPISEHNEFINQAHDELVKENVPESEKTDKKIKDRAIELYKKNPEAKQKAAPIEEKTEAAPEKKEETVPVKEETEATPKKEEATPKEEEVVQPKKPSTVKEVLSDSDKVFVYNGERGTVTTDGQQVVFKTPSTTHELGNVDELADTTLEKLGITEESINVNEDNSVEINGETYTNPELEGKGKSIKKDKKGKYTVTLINSKGEKVIFKGAEAEEIVYKTKLKSNEKATPTTTIAEAKPQAEVQKPTKTEKVEAPVTKPDTDGKNPTTTPTAVNGDVQPGTNNEGEVSTTEQVATAEESVQSTANTGDNKTNVEPKVTSVTEVTKVTKEEKIAEKVKLSDAKIDAKAEAVKAKLKAFTDMFPHADINPEDYHTNSFNSAAIVDMVAKAAKSIAKGAIVTEAHIKEAIKAFNTHFDDDVDFDAVKEAVKEPEAKKEEEAEPKEEPKKTTDEEKVEELLNEAANIPNSDKIGKYESGETIQKNDEHEALTTDQKIDILDIIQAGEHGKSIVAKAEKHFGENYISKVLEIVEKLKNHDAKTLMILSLDNHLRDQRSALIKALKLATNKADKAQIKKEILATTQKINRVQAARQTLANISSRAMNLNKLGSLMREGSANPNFEKKMLTEAEVKVKEEIKKSVETTIDDIQEEYESSNSDIDDLIEGKTPTTGKKRKRETIKKELQDAFAAMRKDFFDAGKGKGGTMASVPLLPQIIAITPHVVKISTLMTELGTLKASEIVDKIYKAIHDFAPDVTKDHIQEIIDKNKLETEEKNWQDDHDKAIAKAEEAIKEHGKEKPLKEGAKSVWSQKLSDLKNQLKDLRNEATNARKKVRENLSNTKDLLVKAGFGKEITVTKSQKDENGNIVRDENGKIVKVKEKKNVLDWTKLFGENGSVDFMKENIARVLGDEGYSQSEIDSMTDEMENSLEKIKTDIIEKKLEALQNDAKIPKSINPKGESKKLADAYERGLFEDNDEIYDDALNRILGFNDFKEAEYKELRVLSKALADLFNNKTLLNKNKFMSEETFKSQVAIINKKVEKIINDAFKGQKITKQKVVSFLKDLVDMSTVSKLLSTKQFVENPFSGIKELFHQKVGGLIFGDNKLTKDLQKRIKENSKRVKDDIIYNNAPDYGDSSFSDIQSKKLHEYLLKLFNEKVKDNKNFKKISNAIASGLSGNSYLNAQDGYYKSLFTETLFAKNAIDFLSNKKLNPDADMTVDEATIYITEKLTGQNYDDAVIRAEEIIDKVNKEAGKIILPKNKENIHRFAMDVVRNNLVSNNVLNEEQVNDIFKASWLAAGSSIGHEANNPISERFKDISSGLDKQIKKAKKEKNYHKFAQLAGLNMAKNIMIPFLSGRFNWAVLYLQASGLDFGISYRNTKREYKHFEKQGDLMQTLHWKMRHDLTRKRMIVGFAVNVLALSSLVASGKEDELNKYLEKNPTFKKFFTVLIPPFVSIYLSHKRGGIESVLETLYSIYNVESATDKRSIATEFKKLYSDTTSEKSKDKSLGYLGRAVGSTIDTPLPWRFGSDVRNIYNDFAGEELYKPNYNATSFASGVFQGGMFESIGLRETISGHKEKKQSKKGESSKGGGRGAESRGRGAVERGR
ncbi:MAG TPA: hypothetical protein VIV55_09995 [Flavobacterium sp.]